LLFEDVPGLGYAARYERARKLLQIGQAQQAQELFLDLYTKARAAGVLPPFDESLRRALQGTDGSDKWSSLMRDTASALLENRQRIAAIVLAWQCWQAGDQPLANELFTMASVDPLDKKQRLTSWVEISYLVQTSQYERARELLLQLLTDSNLAK